MRRLPATTTGSGHHKPPSSTQTNSFPFLYFSFSPFFHSCPTNTVSFFLFLFFSFSFLFFSLFVSMVLGHFYYKGLRKLVLDFGLGEGEEVGVGGDGGREWDVFGVGGGKVYGGEGRRWWWVMVLGLGRFDWEGAATVMGFEGEEVAATVRMGDLVDVVWWLATWCGGCWWSDSDVD